MSMINQSVLRDLIPATNTLEAGRVLRYHAAPTVPPQTVAHHAWGVAHLVLYLTERTCSKSLLMAALYHDNAEIITGDIPFSAKRNYDNLKQVLKETETDIAVRGYVCNVPDDLTPAELAVLKLADTLEGFIWCKKTEVRPAPVLERWRRALNVGLDKFKEEGLISENLRTRAWSIVASDPQIP